MNILVTGGAGYKGVLLSYELLKLGHNVTIMDNFMYGYEPVLFLMQYPNLSILKKDIRNVEESDLSKQDVIYHLAGISGYPACEANPHSAQLINVEATKRFCTMLGREQIVIYASTTSFYGKSGNLCTEDTPIEPVSLYGITKYEAEKFIMLREHSVALRFATVFGVSPKMRTDLLVNDFTYKAVNDRCIVLFENTSKRTFIHICDAVRAYLFVLDHYPSMKGNVFNVGDNSLNFTKQEISEAISKATGCTIIDSSLDDFDVRNFEVSFDKIKTLGYGVEKTLDDGIQEMVRLYGFYKPFLAYRTI